MEPRDLMHVPPMVAFKAPDAEPRTALTENNTLWDGAGAVVVPFDQIGQQAITGRFADFARGRVQRIFAPLADFKHFPR